MSLVPPEPNVGETPEVESSFMYLLSPNEGPFPMSAIGRLLVWRLDQLAHLPSFSLTNAKAARLSGTLFPGTPSCYRTSLFSFPSPSFLLNNPPMDLQ